jgi:metal-responsive CopG/Arc/MetJ family transcriptional regulator
MEIAVSLPEDVFQQAEELAATLGVSRNELYTTALAAFVNQQRHDLITERLNQVYANANSDVDAVLKQMQAVSLPEERW